MHNDIHGLRPALLIPVMADGQVGSVRAICHVRCMLDAGCDGAVLLGTTGEGPAFSTGDQGR